MISMGICSQYLSTYLETLFFFFFQLFLGEYPNEHFSGDATLATIEAFQDDLKRIAETINERNESIEIPYSYLLPSRIPNSISS